ncbi:zinc-binding oxidoreductase [Acephala macrosclerotiorum]|nr:zinc-binding oxidoreductase [Acephala macrosclerotiorum]
MKAIVLNGKSATVVDFRPVPKLRDDYLLIKTIAVALNPTDAKAIAQGRGAKNGLSGCDFAGVVEEVGRNVTKPWEKGDRVFGCTHGANSSNAEDGAFAEIIEAATVGVSAITRGQGLFQKMKLNLPSNPILDARYILIYGGSTSAGTLAIQYAKLYLVKSRGAEAVFDYNDPACGQQIYDYTKGDLKLVWDTIGSEQGIQICMTSLSARPGCYYGTILLNEIPRKDVVCTSSVLMTFPGEAFDLFVKHFPASTENFEFAKMFTTLIEKLLAEGKLKPHPVKLCEGGLQGALEGLNLVGDGKVSGIKLVYQVAENP